MNPDVRHVMWAKPDGTFDVVTLREVDRQSCPTIEDARRLIAERGALRPKPLVEIADDLEAAVADREARLDAEDAEQRYIDSGDALYDAMEAAAR